MPQSQRASTPDETRPIERPALHPLAALLLGGASLVAVIWFGKVYGPPYVTWLQSITAGAQGYWGSGYIVAGIALGTALFIPITLLLSAVALAFEPGVALLYALCGGLFGAALGHTAGRLLGSKVVERWSGNRTRAFAATLRANGFRAGMVARVLPVGNFTLINLLAGGLGVPFWRFIAGSVLGMLPGTIGLIFVVRGLEQFMARHTLPSLRTLLLWAVPCVLVAGLLVGLLVRRRAGRHAIKAHNLDLRADRPPTAPAPRRAPRPP